MKFDSANKSIRQNIKKSKALKKDKDFSYSRLFKFDIYNNVSISLMKPEMKGHFNYLSQLINDGEKIMPLSLKITCINEIWSVYVGHNPEVKNLDLQLEETLNKLRENNIEISQTNNYYILTNIKDKFSTEEIVNLLLKELENVSVEPLEIDEINVKYTVEQKKSGLYTVPDDFLYDTDFDDETYKKFLKILDKLEKTLMSKNDKKAFHKIGFKLIKNRYLNKHDRETLNRFMQTYFPEKERIKIAMSYLLNRNN